MDHGGVSDPQLEIKFRQQSLEPASLPAGFHSHTNLHPLCRQITVEFLRFLAVIQSPLSAVAGGNVHKSNLLEGRVIIASYNQHIGSFLPSLFGWLCTTKAYSGLRSRHCHGINYTQNPVSECNRDISTVEQGALLRSYHFNTRPTFHNRDPQSQLATRADGKARSSAQNVDFIMRPRSYFLISRTKF